jgi:sortase A
VRRVFVVFCVALIAAGGLLLTEQGWLRVKAAVAEVLIDRAFVAHLHDGKAHRPWSWADMHPVARLDVLSGATGSSLAFGAGHIDGTAAPNGIGNCALAGHRDSWFSFLEQLRVGDVLILRSHDGATRYLVHELIVAHRSDTELLEPTDSRQLTLITCYPFGGLTPSDWRYVVAARPFADRVAADRP